MDSRFNIFKFIDKPLAGVERNPTRGNIAFLDGMVAQEFDLLFDQLPVRQAFFDHVQTTPWKSIDLSDRMGSQFRQHLFITLNDLAINVDSGVAEQINPAHLPSMPFSVLADCLEAAVNVADF
jgi:hypothetical protein